jgi:hypothetical protein
MKSTALLALALCATACASETRTAGEGPLAQGDDRVIEGVIDGSSTLWETAPFPHEAPRECPLGDDVPAVAMLAWEHVVEASAEMLVDVSLEGSSVHAALTGEPELIVYRGDAMPADAADARDCEGAAKPGGGEPGVVTGIPVETGERLLVVAYTPGTTGFAGDDAGTFRLRITAR